MSTIANIGEIIKSFCYRINVPAPATIVGSTGPTERQYLEFFRFIGENLRNRPFQWPQLKRGYTFTTETDVRKYQLPGDFYRILDSSQWDTTNNWPMRGPISDFNFAIREFAVVSLQTRKAYRIIGPTQYLYTTTPYQKRSQGYFEIDPPGGNNTDELFLGYISCNWVWPTDWAPLTVYATGALVTGNGYVYYATIGGTSGSTRPSVSTGTEVDGTVTWQVWTETYPVQFDNSYLSDSNLCLFDSDLMIEGMRWAYLRAKGLDYQQERADWESQVNSAFSRFDGPQRINIGDSIFDNFDWPNVADGSWQI